MSASAGKHRSSDIIDRRGPRIFVPPPVITLALLSAGWGAEQYWSLAISVASWPLWAGIGLLSLSLVLVIAAALPFFTHKTSIEPWQPTTKIIQSGIYAYSRNPIYLAFCMATVGAGFLVNSAWVLGTVFPLIIILQFVVIRREENYLEGKFGEHYADYRARVRRWL